MSIGLLILLFAGFSILSAVLDAKSDAIRDNGSVNHFIEFLQVLNNVLDGVLLGIIVAQNHYYGLKTSIILFFLLIGCFTFIRFSVFNISYNNFRTPKKPLHYVGSSDKASLVDKWFTIIPEKYRVIVYAVSTFIAVVLLSIVEYVLI